MLHLGGAVPVTRMKKSGTQSRKHTRNIYPAEHTAAGEADSYGATPAENGAALADVVWKHFAEEIAQVLAEVQQALRKAGLNTSK